MKPSFFLAVVLFAATPMTLVACGSDEPAPAARVCVPGTTLACVGPGQCAGFQACSLDGATYGACTCGGDSGMSTNHPNPGPDANGDSSTQNGDSSTQMDVATTADVSGGGSEGGAPEGSTSEGGTSEAGSKDGGAACTKVESSFVCAPFTPADLAAGSTACSTADVHGFMTDCFQPTGTVAACKPWLQGTTTCNQCIQRWYDGGTLLSESCLYVALHATAAVTQQHCRDYEKCATACVATACNATKCSSTTVDGATELDRCYDVVAAPLGACSEPLTLGAGCHDSAFEAASQYCIPQDLLGAEYFFRGACRDNSDWSHVGLDGG